MTTWTPHTPPSHPPPRGGAPHKPPQPHRWGGAASTHSSTTVLPRGLGDYSGEGAHRLGSRRSIVSSPIGGGSRSDSRPLPPSYELGPPAAEPYPTYGGQPAHTASGTRASPTAGRVGVTRWASGTKSARVNQQQFNCKKPPVFTQHPPAQIRDVCTDAKSNHNDRSETGAPRAPDRTGKIDSPREKISGLVRILASWGAEESSVRRMEVTKRQKIQTEDPEFWGRRFCLFDIYHNDRSIAFLRVAIDKVMA